MTSTNFLALTLTDCIRWNREIWTTKNCLHRWEITWFALPSKTHLQFIPWNMTEFLCGLTTYHFSLSLSSPSCILWKNFLEGFTSSSSLKGTIVDEWDFMWIYFTIPKQIASKRSNLYILFWMNKRTRKSRSRALCEGTDAERNWNNCLILYVNTPPSESERRTFIRQGSKEIKIKWNSQKSSRNFSQGSQFTPYCKPSCW